MHGATPDHVMETPCHSSFEVYNESKGSFLSPTAEIEKSVKTLQ